MKDTLIRIVNGRLIDPHNGIDKNTDVYVANGCVAAFGQPPSGCFSSTRSIDAQGCIVAPGLVDLSARLGCVETELAAAAAGGVTTLACPPDTQPVLDEAGPVERLVRRSEIAGLAHVFPLGALTQALAGEKLAELATLHQAGCIAFSQAQRPLVDTQVLLRAMQYAASFGLTLHLQPQDYYLARNGVAHDGETAARLGLAGIPVSAETVAVATFLQLARDTGVRLHLSRISSAAGMALINAARRERLAVTCDIACHHLHLCDEDIGYFDSRARFTPPLRTRADREALRKAVAEGMAVICSDHTPLGADDKQLPFAEARPGATALELLLPLTLRWAKECGVPLIDALARITCAPAEILGIPAGTLTLGAPADICIFNPEAAWDVTEDTLVSQGKNTPFADSKMHGKVKATLVGGRLVFGA